MFELLFMILILICAASIIAISLSYKDFFSILLTAVLALFALLAVWLNTQMLLLLFVFVLAFVSAFAFYKQKFSLTSIASMCMLSVIVLAYAGVQLLADLDNQFMFLAALFFVSAISALGIFGIFEENIVRYLLISNALQLMFIVLDLSIVKLSGKVGVLMTIQIFNYVFAGTLLFTALCVLTDNLKRKEFGEIRRYQTTPINAIAASIAALSLAGIPTLNIFVAEWYLFITAYPISPAITVLSIFAALILFIMYFKIIFALFAGKQIFKRKGIEKGIGREVIVPTAINVLLALICVVFGMLPGLQLWLLGG